ncbi:ATP-binding protein [Dyadobacter sp. 3J3]|uniref:sensor histidine kinase n=1 Tax=Dyadobacter sp. 3J3 TaxID=2606600 RepID=UPI00135A9EE3|nr:ATP-binding protein [Dyadobacter sp. 3J3]
MKKYPVILVILLILASNKYIFAQLQTNDQDDYTVKYYTEDNGLPQNSVKNISADSEGFIWLTTETGLVRFDGQNFFTFDKSNLPITYNRFSMLQPSLEGGKKDNKSRKLYAVAEGYQFVRIEAGKASIDTLYTNRIRSIPHLNNSGENVLLSNGSPNYLRDWLNPDYYIITVSEGEGNFFICERQKIEYYSNWKKIYDYTIKTPLPWNFFTIQKNLYTYTDGKFVRIDKSGLRDLSITGDIKTDANYVPGKLNGKIYWNNISDQVFIYIDKKLYALQEGPGGILKTALLVNNFDFVKNNITTIHYDTKNHRLFLGSVTKGLFVLKNKSFYTLRTKGNDLQNVFYGQAIFDSNSVITPKGYIVGKSLENKKVILKDYPLIQSEKTADGYGIITDKKGNIWRKSGNILFCYNTKGRKMTGKWDLKTEVNHLYEDEKGTIWIGTRSSGLFCINLSDQEPAPRQFIKGPLDRISFILQKTPQTLVIGTAHGLFLLNLFSKKLIFVKGTEKLYVRSLFISSSADAKNTDEKEIWITTYEDGFFLFSKNKLIKFPLDKHKYLSGAHCIFPDKLGYFWLTTNKGLFRIAKKDLLDYAANHFASEHKSIFSMHFTKEQGFYTNEFNGGCQPCALRLPNGYFSLPSLDGLVWFIPENITIELPDKNIILDRYEVGGKSIAASGDSIKFPLNPQNIKIHLTTAYFGNPADLNISYALVEKAHSKTVPDQWLDVEATNTTIPIGRLNAGNYTLFIRKNNGFGRDNYMYKKISILVPPDWYETQWFRIAALFLFIFAVYLFIRLRLRIIKKENRLLEIKIARRTRKLEHTFSALEKSERELHRQMHIQTRLIASMSHDIKTPLKFVSNAAGRIENMLENEKIDAVAKLGKTIEQSTDQMYNLLENLIAYVKTQVYGSNIEFKETNLFNSLSEKFKIFEHVIHERSNQFTNEVEPLVNVVTNAQLLGIIVHNLIDNANKFSFNANINIRTAVMDAETHLIISDTGPGMPDELLNWLNTPSKTDSFEKSKSISIHYNGLGLTIVKELAMLLNVGLRVKKNKGTQVHLIFPKSKTM